jgi:glycine dehydrogenase subunit 2
MTGAAAAPERGAPGGKATSAPLLGRETEPTLFELSHPGRRAWSFRTTGIPELPLEELVPEGHRRKDPVPLAEVSERDLVAHFTRLSHRQFSVDLGAYPLGSCTMKYNPKVCDTVACLPGLAGVHPAAPASLAQGWLGLMVELEEILCEITGMAAATLQPAAGAAGELTGLLLMRAWHQAQGSVRHKVIIPDSAHGTNPASVTLGGYEVVTVPSDERGCVDMDALAIELDEDVAGIMLTNPNTLGLFEEDIAAIAAAVHEVGGLLYYDGANLNAILGVVRPGDMGFDIVHMNLHKTFATPHGGGGPGAGPVAVSDRLVPFLPGPRAVQVESGGQAPVYEWRTPPQSIGRMHTWHGNALVLARALAYILVNGGDGLRRIAETAVLNANWIRQRLTGTYDVPFNRPCMHEAVLSVRTMKQDHRVRALDVAKRLLEEGFHSPTVYFPLIVEEALMIEPTETESLQTLEALAESLERIAAEAAGHAQGWMSEFPHSTPVRRLDEARAARTLIPTFDARP